MALYDGFFDAVYNEETGKFDREYDSSHFVQYFGQMIGSGVCIHNNPDSMLVYLDGGAAIVKPGYLWIQGYYLANAADPDAGENPATYKGYEIPLTSSDPQAIIAHLNMGKKMIELQARTVADSYPDALCLGIVDPANREVIDTRYDIGICGVIDSAGSLSSKVEYAVNYINNEIDGKLEQIGADIAAQDQLLDNKIAEVQTLVDQIVPPPVGSIKFSASQNVGPEWLRCDGSFVNEQDYPELVASLGKLTPSGDKFRLISSGEIGTQISNGVVFGGRMWVYSYAAKKLYGVDLEGTAAVKEVSVTSESQYFSNLVSPTQTFPIVLSIVHGTEDGKYTIFLSQIRTSSSYNLQDNTKKELSLSEFSPYLSIFSSEFTGEEDSVDLKEPFVSINKYNLSIGDLFRFDGEFVYPSVVSVKESGETYYLCTIGVSFLSGSSTNSPIYTKWSGLESRTVSLFDPADYRYAKITGNQRVSFSHKSKNELVFVSASVDDSRSEQNSYSFPTGIWNDRKIGKFSATREKTGPVNIVGSDKILFSPSDDGFSVFRQGNVDGSTVDLGLSFPSAHRFFVDAGAYLWGKDIFMIFVGTGIIFSRTLEECSFGYLDTTNIMGTITQFGYLDYSQDENTLYLLGQDTNNHVKVAKMELNTLYDYANDGAWLPMIASDGVPAYIKAYEPGDGGGPGSGEMVQMSITVLTPNVNNFSTDFSYHGEILFNKEVFSVPGTYLRTVDKNGKFTVGIKSKAESVSHNIAVLLNGQEVASANNSKLEDEAEFNVSDFLDGITIQGVYRG